MPKASHSADKIVRTAPLKRREFLLATRKKFLGFFRKISDEIQITNAVVPAKQACGRAGNV